MMLHQPLMLFLWCGAVTAKATIGSRNLVTGKRCIIAKNWMRKLLPTFSVLLVSGRVVTAMAECLDCKHAHPLKDSRENYHSVCVCVESEAFLHFVDIAFDGCECGEPEAEE